MDHLTTLLKHCTLFKNLSAEEMMDILASTDYTITTFTKGVPIAIEDEKCLSIGIILTGNVEVQKIFASGRVLTVDRLKSGDLFGQVIIFSEINQFPATIIASTVTEVMYISKKDIIKLCSSNTLILNNFMGLLSDRIVMLNNKIKDLSYKSIRQKISNFIIEEYAKQKSLTLVLPFSREEMANELGVPRPSLSRELIAMKKEGLLTYEKNIINIKDLIALEDSLLE